MKLFSVIGLACACAFGATNPQLGKVQSVYILPMANGMDQFLANQLTNSGVFQVVADPQKADALVTDRLGETFEDKMKELYPAPKPPQDEQTEQPKDKVEQAGALFAPPPMQSTFARGKGNFFVVDRQSRYVLWSTYERPRNSSPDELTRAAAKVVRHLKQALEPPK